VKVKLRSIETVRPYESNPRVNDQAVEAGAKSLREFGFRQPIVVDADGVIMMELDPSHCDVIWQRWEQFTGQKAEREGQA
jgi:hypothetical protein